MGYEVKMEDKKVNMEKYELSINDMYSGYFHFTKKINLSSIEKNGLVPTKGEHAQYLEKSKKVFFFQGLDNLLILFDCWINVYKKAPLLPEITHKLGVIAMCSKYFPMCLVDLYFKTIKNSKRHKNYAYKIFDKLLEECVLLKLDIHEGEDFSLDDIDEIKSSSYRRRHLVELGYSSAYSDVNSNEMDKWNLHTFSDRKVDNSKIKLCFINNQNNIKDIFLFALKNTKLYLKNVCPVLYDYMETRNMFESI